VETQRDDDRWYRLPAEGRAGGRAWVDWATSIVRALGCFLSLFVVGLGFLWIAIDDERQAWHDKIAGTVVVRVPRSVPLV
jgi:uncharacterized RDD family membrane protein YckC